MKRVREKERKEERKEARKEENEEVGNTLPHDTETETVRMRK